MNTWQKAEFDAEGNVIGPKFAVEHSATWPLLVRFENDDGTISQAVSNRYNLTCENENYVSIHVAPVVWPGEL
jgi:hypothetical protein